jgi:hypothetical protein
MEDKCPEMGHSNEQKFAQAECNEALNFTRGAWIYKRAAVNKRRALIFNAE